MKLPKIDPKLAKEEIVNFIREMSNKTNSDGFIIGLSGGLDSTVVAYLLKEAVGSEKIYSYHLPSSSTPKEDTLHARLVAELLNLNFREINIDTITDEFLNLTNSGNVCTNKDISNKEHRVNKTTKGNLKARIRMILLYYFANLKNCLVTGTGNRSELLIGYFTKYGDGACDFEPIGDIYKTQLKKLAKSWNIPNEIITKPPRAGLWKNQTDEGEIGLNYNVLDLLLYYIVDKNLTDEDILKEMNVLKKMSVSLSEIAMVREKIAANKHKLHSPPSHL